MKKVFVTSHIDVIEQKLFTYARALYELSDRRSGYTKTVYYVGKYTTLIEVKRIGSIACISIQGTEKNIQLTCDLVTSD